MTVLYVFLVTSRPRLRSVTVSPFRTADAEPLGTLLARRIVTQEVSGRARRAEMHRGVLLALLPVLPAIAAAPPTAGAWKPKGRLAVLSRHYRSLDLTGAQLRQLYGITLWYAPRADRLQADVNALLRTGVGKVRKTEAA